MLIRRLAFPLLLLLLLCVVSVSESGPGSYGDLLPRVSAWQASTSLSLMEEQPSRRQEQQNSP